jgi:hypothetical protein
MVSLMLNFGNFFLIILKDFNIDKFILPSPAIDYSAVQLRQATFLP